MRFLASLEPFGLPRTLPEARTRARPAFVLSLLRLLSIRATLQDWHVQFYSYNEPFLDTTGPFAGFLIPLFAWLARQDSIRKGKAVKLGMDKARSQGKAVGRPSVVDKVDAELVARLRDDGRSWREIAEAHPTLKSASGKKVNPSVGSMRRALMRKS